MQKDPYDWAKERIGYLIEKIELSKVTSMVSKCQGEKIN